MPTLPEAVAEAPAAAVPLRLALRADPHQRYWLYVPPAARERGARAPMVISVHGISRNAGAHVRAWVRAADRHGCIVVAPQFSRQRFADFQRFGRAGRIGPGGRADHVLWAVVDEVRSQLGLPEAPLRLFGHSAGAQFVQRMALAYGPRIGRCVLSAPGSYAWPDEGRCFPQGVAPSPDFADLRPSLEHLLRPRTLVLVGERDTERGSSLRQGPRIDAEQGRTRLERAHTYVHRLQMLAHARGWEPPARLQVLPAVAHAFSECVAQAALIDHAAAHLLA
jgi:pimeloyl-ACP methyl ester carboxylesterase